MFALTAVVLGVIVFLAGVGPADSPWDPPSVRQQYITRWHQYPKEDLLLMVGMIATVVVLALFKGRSK
jgi:hypothetical protein